MTDQEKTRQEYLDQMEAREREQSLTLARSEALAPRVSGAVATYLDPALFEQAQRAAKLLASAGEMVPAHFQGNPAKCFVALELANRFEISPFMALQSIYVVHGRPGIEAKLAIALANDRAPIDGPIDWIFDRDQSGKIVACTAYAILKKSGRRVEMTVTREIVRAEGWDTDKPRKNGGTQKSKWNTMPELMFRYRSAMWLIRTYFPDVILGMKSEDELKDVETIEAEWTPQPEPPKSKHRLPAPRDSDPDDIPDPESDKRLVALDSFLDRHGKDNTSFEALQRSGIRSGKCGFDMRTVTADRLAAADVIIADLRTAESHSDAESPAPGGPEDDHLIDIYEQLAMYGSAQLGDSGWEDMRESYGLDRNDPSTLKSEAHLESIRLEIKRLAEYRRADG